MNIQGYEIMFKKVFSVLVFLIFFYGKAKLVCRLKLKYTLSLRSVKSETRITRILDHQHFGFYEVTAIILTSHRIIIHTSSYMLLTE